MERHLVKHGATMDIHTASYLGDLKAVKSFLKRSPRLLDQGYPSAPRDPIDARVADFKLPAALAKKVARLKVRSPELVRTRLLQIRRYWIDRW